MLAVRLEPQLEQDLAHLAKETGRTKSFYVKEALVTFMEERMDYLLAIAALERNEPRTSLEDVRKELGL